MIDDAHRQAMPAPKIEELPRTGPPTELPTDLERLAPPITKSTQAGQAPLDVQARDVDPPTRGHPNNLHNNVTFRPELLWRLTNLPADGSSVSPAMRQRIGQAAIHEFLGRADQHLHLPVRAIGAKWSLSQVAETHGWLALTEDMAYTKTSLGSTHPDSPYSPDELAWVQCGTRVAQLNVNLGKCGRSLLTTGASNGQTILGATATGTHGAAFRVGSMHDTICGMHIMCSQQRSVWLEPAAAPVVTDDVARVVFGAHCEVIRDDDTFHAALVSFGSFGFVESVIVKTVPLFLLTAVRTKHAWNDLLKAEIRGLAQNHDQNANGDLYHYEVTFDPLELATSAALHPWVTKIYSTRAPDGYDYVGATLPKHVIITDPAAVRWAGVGARLLPRVMLRQASKLLHERFPILTGQEGSAPLGVMFTDVVMDALGASTEIGVAASDAPRAADVIRSIFRESFKQHKPFLGPMSMRFVAASCATLAFTHFGPISCCIELPGARMAWSDEFYRRVFSALDAANVPFALHWGQENDFCPERIQRSYGAARISSWQRARARVLDTPELRARFSSRLLESWGLA
jgi:hypothetical protein